MFQVHLHNVGRVANAD